MWIWKGIHSECSLEQGQFVQHLCLFFLWKTCGRHCKKELKIKQLVLQFCGLIFTQNWGNFNYFDSNSYNNSGEKKKEKESEGEGKACSIGLWKRKLWIALLCNYINFCCLTEINQSNIYIFNFFFFLVDKNEIHIILEKSFSFWC